MTRELVVYLIAIASPLRSSLCFLTMIIFLSGVALAMIAEITDIPRSKEITINRAIFLFLIAGLLCIFISLIPTKEALSIILGVK